VTALGEWVLTRGFAIMSMTVYDALSCFVRNSWRWKSISAVVA
jgi:hypothetical protein